jgi:hypothetical protein
MVVKVEDKNGYDMHTFAGSIGTTLTATMVTAIKDK